MEEGCRDWSVGEVVIGVGVNDGVWCCRLWQVTGREMRWRSKARVDHTFLLIKTC